MTLPGVPMVFAGDELGLEGQWGEDARRTMPWGGQWDEAFVGEVRALTRLRRSLPALARGGLRFVHVAPDAIAFLRETKDERLLVLAQRTPEEISLPFDQLELLYDHDLFRIWRIR